MGASTRVKNHCERSLEITVPDVYANKLSSVFILGTVLLVNREGDRQGPRSTPLLSRPYYDMERFHQQYLDIV